MLHGPSRPLESHLVPLDQNAIVWSCPSKSICTSRDQITHRLNFSTGRPEGAFWSPATTPQRTPITPIPATDWWRPTWQRLAQPWSRWPKYPSTGCGNYKLFRRGNTVFSLAYFLGFSHLHQRPLIDETTAVWSRSDGWLLDNAPERTAWSFAKRLKSCSVICRRLKWLLWPRTCSNRTKPRSGQIDVMVRLRGTFGRKLP